MRRTYRRIPAERSQGVSAVLHELAQGFDFEDELKALERVVAAQNVHLVPLD